MSGGIVHALFSPSFPIMNPSAGRCLVLTASQKQSSECLHLPFFACFSAANFLSFFPPCSISRWPALLARDFSVKAVSPEECFCILVRLGAADKAKGLAPATNLLHLLLLLQSRFLGLDHSVAGLLALGAGVSVSGQKCDVVGGFESYSLGAPAVLFLICPWAMLVCSQLGEANVDSRDLGRSLKQKDRSTDAFGA